MTIKNNEPNQAILQQLAGAFTSIPFNQMLGLKLDHIEASHIHHEFST